MDAIATKAAAAGQTMVLASTATAKPGVCATRCCPSFPASNKQLEIWFCANWLELELPARLARRKVASREPAADR